MNRILLAEDNDDLRELITDFLSEHGFDVHAAVDGEDAWEAVQTIRYQLVLCLTRASKNSPSSTGGDELQNKYSKYRQNTCSA